MSLFNYRGYYVHVEIVRFVQGLASLRHSQTIYKFRL